MPPSNAPTPEQERSSPLSELADYLRGQSEMLDRETEEIMASLPGLMVGDDESIDETQSRLNAIGEKKAIIEDVASIALREAS